MRARRIVIAVSLIIVFVAVFVFPAVDVYTVRAFIDRNTGSRKGYREWPFGWRTGSWYRESAIETYMRSNHPDEFRQDWVSYQGTAWNIYGRAMSFGHGSPGPIVLLPFEVLDDLCQTASDKEKRRFYDVFATGDETKINELVHEVLGESTTSEGGETDRAANGARPVRLEINRTPSSAGSRH